MRVDRGGVGTNHGRSVMKLRAKNAEAVTGEASQRAAVLAMMLGVAALAGCHHQSRVAYQPPPPVPQRVPMPRPVPPVVARGGATESVPQSTDSFDDISGKPVFTEIGQASWYGPPYHNHAAADGSIFDQNAMTAAHRTLPMGSTLRVTNIATNQSVLVRVTDRGPFVPGRVLDLSMGAAKAIGVWRPGVAQVKVEAFAHASSNPAGKWCVQMGAFKSESEARDVQAALVQRYKTSKVMEFAGPTGHWVRVNPATPDLAHANEVARWLDTPDAAALPYVVRID